MTRNQLVSAAQVRILPTAHLLPITRGIGITAINIGAPECCAPESLIAQPQALRDGAAIRHQGQNNIHTLRSGPMPNRQPARPTTSFSTAACSTAPARYRTALNQAVNMPLQHCRRGIGAGGRASRPEDLRPQATAQFQPRPYITHPCINGTAWRSCPAQILPRLMYCMLDWQARPCCVLDRQARPYCMLDQQACLFPDQIWG